MYLELKNINKEIDKKQVLDEIDLLIENNPFLCIMGDRASGKSILLRVIAGIYKSDTGAININDNDVSSSLEYQKNIFYVPDMPLFIEDETIDRMIKIYKGFYKDFNVGYARGQVEFFFETCNLKISSLSIEDKKVLAIIFAISSEAKYVLLDETFDNIGKDRRDKIFELMLNENKNRGLTLIFTTQNISETYDIATDIILLKNGRIAAHKNLEEEGLNMCKVQYIDKSFRKPDEIFGKYNIINVENTGLVYTVLIYETKSRIDEYLKSQNLDFYEFLKLNINDLLYDVKNNK